MLKADAVDQMRKRLAELLDDPGLLARYRAALDGQAVGRMVPSLPRTSTPSPLTAVCGSG
ncbi:hypothetical protein [Streptomyces sp. NPDC094149]|uniref:hypothetical protein n=1 Tax=Streptomyces sp. NPDC094149 TaxID=3155079 RepID=UPI0033260D29